VSITVEAKRSAERNETQASAEGVSIVRITLKGEHGDRSPYGQR